VNQFRPNSKAAAWKAAQRRPLERTVFCAAVTAFLVAGALAAMALEPTTPLANYGRQSWVMENGLPQNTVQALAQTRDGFVWLGTEVGLVRFDGNGFAVFDKNSSPALPGNDIRCLLAARDGSLWIGTSEGLARLKDGTVRAFSARDGLPGDSILGLAETTNGTVWAWADGGVARLRGDHFKSETVADGLPQGTITSIAAGSDDFLWVGTTFDAASWRAEKWLPLCGGTGKCGRSFVTAGPNGWVQIANVLGVSQLRGSGWHVLANARAMPPAPIESIVYTPSGIAVANKTMFAEFVGGNSQTPFFTGKELPGTRIQAVFTDRQGSVWIGTNAGLARWAAGKLQRLPVTDPLATASVLALMEDREGNLWAGTETGGLHILRDQRFRTLGAREGLSSDATTTVVEDNAGRLWVGTSGAGLNVFPHDAIKAGPVLTYSVRNGLLSDVILSLAAAPNGDLWVGTPDGLNRIRRGSIASFTSADGLPDDFIRSLMADADGSLWIGTRRGLTHWTGGVPGAHMQTYTQASGLGSDLVGAMARDSAGDLWVATLAGLSRIKNGRIENYTIANGLSSNVVTALLPRGNGLLIGTQESGWNWWDGHRFSMVAHNGHNPAQAAIHAILDDGGNHLWFATGSGIARCDCDMAGGCSHWMEFGAADGLRSRETAINSHPSAWRSRDGHLWFATPKGLVEVDPAHFPVNTVPPPVVLERFTVDDALRAAGPRLSIEAGHVHFEFDYAALSFIAPQKVRYRYMLEGFDRGWTDAGARRTAYYTNIPPGRYTFRVQAANNDGLWNTEGAALSFELRPHFYQTVWFYLLLAAAAAGLIVLLLRRRLRVAQRQFSAVLGERNRIAREIHDTLAQGYVGVSVQLEVLAELLRLHKVDAAQKHLDTTRGYVREGLADARQSIWALRSQDSGETTLPVRLRRMVEADRAAGLECKFNIFGAYRPLPPGVEREILRVAQEAIHNVKKHAGAANLFAQLEYGSSHITLEVRDDGRGFSAEPELTPGHYGLTGMRERAASIGATLEVTSEPGGGTAVRLRAPAPRETRERTGEPT
jgi:signal transduction histidine kinase/ligand-binding sensor domain-containing protein